MAKLRAFHRLGLRVDHEFDLFSRIDFYESLWEGRPSAYPDYRETKAAVLALRPFIEANAGARTLTHIDAVPDNFLFFPDGCGGEALRLIDWEYAAMQDPHVDVAMFCIYAMYGLGVEFGAYSLAQYRYARDYCGIVRRELEALGEVPPCTP